MAGAGFSGATGLSRAHPAPGALATAAPSETPKVTIVIPCFDLGRYLPEAVDSVLAQTYEVRELVIVDDGSTDERTLSVLDGYRRAGISVLRIPKSGPSAARNRGIEATSGDYVLCLDADDVLMPTFLEQTVARLDELPDVGVATTYAAIFGRRRGLYRASDYDPVRLLWQNLLGGVSSLFRRVCWEEVGGFSLDGLEDWDLWISIVERGWKWAVVPEPLYRFRLRRGSHTEDALRRREELLRELVRRHQETYQAHVADILVQMDAALRARRQTWPLPWLRWILRRL